MVIQNLPPMGQGHGPAHASKLVKQGPQGFHNLPINLPRPFDKIEGELPEAFLYMDTQMKLSNSYSNIHEFREGQSAALSNTVPKVDPPLAGNIVYKQHWERVWTIGGVIPGSLAN